MLVLSRKPKQSIQIGDTTITVVEVRGGVVKLAFAAPKNVKILRSELQGKAA